CRVYCYPSESAQLDESIPNDRRGLRAGALGESADSNMPHYHPDQEHRVESLEVLFGQAVPVWKRAVDIVGAVVALVFVWPVFLLVGLAIKWSSPGPVIFRQWRNGQGGAPFQMYKFRSMFLDAENRRADLLALNEQDGPAFKIALDPRVTWLGRFLRSTS